MDFFFIFFLVFSEQIIPSGEEMWAGMKVVFDKIIADGKKVYKLGK